MKYIYYNAKFNILSLQDHKTWPYIDETLNVYYIGEI